MSYFERIGKVLRECVKECDHFEDFMFSLQYLLRDYYLFDVLDALFNEGHLDFESYYYSKKGDSTGNPGRCDAVFCSCPYARRI